MINYSLNKQHHAADNIVLIHGLFGDKDNLNNLRRDLTDKFNVMSIDLPDHGQSSNTDLWQFEKVVESINQTLKKEFFEPCNFVGHSLGGKVAMAYALTYPDSVKKLIVADIAPAPYTPRHENVFKALNAVKLDTINSRKEAADVLNSILVEPGTAQFLLKSLKQKDGQWQWQFNLSGIQRDYRNISNWPFKDEQFDGQVTFIKGERSDYINESHGDAIRHHFPQARLKVIGGTGHWLHAEKPSLFNRQVLRILDESRT